MFTFAIYGIGGTQIYARNKLQYMQNHGWKACMVTTEPGKDIMVKEMYPFKDGVFPELMRNPYFYNVRQRKKIINKVLKYIFNFANPADEIVIESNFMAITPWAELVAKELNARNFIFLIQEDYNIQSKRYLDFFYFKYNRGELAVNTSQALYILFKNYPNFKDRGNCFLHAFCSNVVEDSESILMDKLKNADFNIGSVGRINKPFVLPMVSKIAEYVTCYPDYTFNLVLFGGSPNPEDIQAITNITNPVKNLNTLITGPIFPIPLCDLRNMDVCISSAGAALTSTDAGVLTIAVDALDFEPIGIVKVTTNNIIHRDKNDNASLPDLLNQILFEKKYTGLLKPHIENYTEYFNEHEVLLSKADLTKAYYDVSKMSPGLIGRLKLFVSSL